MRTTPLVFVSSDVLTSAQVLPIGEIQPMPVTTTRRQGRGESRSGAGEEEWSVIAK